MFKLLLYVDVFRSGKIPESLYTVYEQQCKKRTAEILEGSMLRVFCVYTCIIVYIYIYIYLTTVGQLTVETNTVDVYH